jgi:hypothetical protein
MALRPALGLLALMAARKLLKSTPTLTWDELQTWISDVSNPDNYGRRYAQQRLPARRADGHIEVRKEPLRGGKTRVSAALFFAPLNQLVTSKDWEVEKLDAKLEKKFGDNLRFTIKV